MKEGTNDIGYVSIEPEDKKNKDKISSIEGVVISTRANALTQAKAYEIKKNSNAIMEVIAADAIGKLPDRNAAEAVQRVQGVAVARYHGEADQATVRGTPLHGRRHFSTEIAFQVPMFWGTDLSFWMLFLRS